MTTEQPRRPANRCPAGIPVVELGFPGEFPFTRGIQPTMYRGRLWTMRQYAGFGTAAESNQRYRYLLGQGVSGLSVAFDLPTQMGYDSDHALAAGEVGRVGVAIDSIEDMAELFDGIPLDQRLDVDDDQRDGDHPARALRRGGAAAGRRASERCRARSRTTSSRSTSRAAPTSIRRAPSLRIVTDIFAYCERELPNWNTISISGYHIREAGSTAVQEVAFTFANAIAYVEAAIDAGLDVNRFGQRLSFFFNAHNDFLEEIAKFRAARRLWARIMRDRFGATQPARAAAALPHADRRQHADRAAARQQHRPRRDAGAGGGARRHAVAALQRPRRGAGAADRGIGAHRAADAADHRRRERRRQHGRSVRRLVRDRGDDRSTSSARRAALLDRIDAAGGTLAAIEAGHHPARDPGVGLPRAAGDRRAASGRRRRQPRSRRASAAARSTSLQHRPGRSKRGRSSASAPVRASARRGGVARGARRASTAAARGSDNLVPPIIARRRGARHRRRDLRRHARASSASTRKSMSDDGGPTRVGFEPPTRRPAPSTAAVGRAPHHRLRSAAAASCPPSSTSASTSTPARRCAWSASPAAASR